MKVYACYEIELHEGATLKHIYLNKEDALEWEYQNPFDEEKFTWNNFEEWEIE